MFFIILLIYEFEMIILCILNENNFLILIYEKWVTYDTIIFKFNNIYMTINPLNCFNIITNNIGFIYLCNKIISVNWGTCL